MQMEAQDLATEIFAVYRPGCDVSIDDITAKVISVIIKSNGYVQYQVVWWNGLVREEKWVEACEITGQPDKMKVIGFVK